MTDERRDGILIALGMAVVIGILAIIAAARD